MINSFFPFFLSFFLFFFFLILIIIDCEFLTVVPFFNEEPAEVFGMLRDLYCNSQQLYLTFPFNHYYYILFLSLFSFFIFLFLSLFLSSFFLSHSFFLT